MEDRLDSLLASRLASLLASRLAQHNAAALRPRGQSLYGAVPIVRGGRGWWGCTHQPSGEEGCEVEEGVAAEPGGEDRARGH